MAYAGANTFTYDLNAVAARFGQVNRTTRWKAIYLQRLIDRLNFPPPLPLMVADRLTEEVRGLSRWNCRAVDQWFDDRAPSGPAAEDPQARRLAERDMDARAEAIGLSVKGGLRLLPGGRA